MKARTTTTAVAPDARRPIFRAINGDVLDRSDVPMGLREAAYELYLVHCFAERDIGASNHVAAKAQLAYAGDLFSAIHRAAQQRMINYTWSGELLRHIERAGPPSPWKKVYNAFRHYLATHP